MSQVLFALIDCNNFFVSCEKLFRPDLEGQPVVVLSSNDGCAVARSNEAKAIGIPMGAPAFKYRQLFEQHRVVRFSANFELYGNVSRRITDLLTTITPRIEVYSIDESFLDLSQLIISDHGEWGRMVHDRILQWIGVPVSIGIAPTKTLAKLAGLRAKKDTILGGALFFRTPADWEPHLAAVPIEDVWGVGWRLAPRLRGEGIATALDLARLRPRRAQQLMGVRGRQVVAELNGVSCYPLEREGRTRKSIARTRTFGEDTTDIGTIEAALATFAARAALRLRESRQVTRRVGVFAQTNKHKPGFRGWNQETYFPVPTADTGKLVSTVMDLFRDFYNPAVQYHRAGVYLWDFLPANCLQTDMFGDVDVAAQDRAMARMATLDAINKRYGRQTLHYAAEDLGKNWQPRQKLRSPHYVSSWDDLPSVRLSL